MTIHEGAMAHPEAVVDPEVAQQIRSLAAQGWGAKRIARELEVARNTVRRYLRGGDAALVQVRPEARALGDAERARAVELFDGVAEGNAVVVHRELARDGAKTSVRTVQRVVAERRREKRAAAVATVRYETAPGHQMQIDFGQKKVSIGEVIVTVHFLVAVLSYSRRVFVKAFLGERTSEWLDGVAAAFRHFGGVVQTLLVDRSRCLVADTDRATGAAVFTPALLQFCRDWQVMPKACAPYRARTKGKTESGVKFVKRNAIAGRAFDSFAAFEIHLGQWMVEADDRIHGTTHEQPRVRYERDERDALRPLPGQVSPVHARVVRRRVANDAFVDVDTVRYSVPYQYVRDTVEVRIDANEVRVLRGGAQVARHVRSLEPHSRVVDPAHHAGLWRPAARTTPVESTLGPLGRSLADYAVVIEGGGP
jgi:transposase